MERFHVYQMRHTFACQWMDRRGNLRALQQVLGHSTIEMTERYGSMTDEVVMREAERIGGRHGTV
jgi:integrase